VLWEIARSSRPLTELLPSVIRRSTVQKNCQKGVNTRENASRRRAAYVYHEARAHRQSIVLSRRFRCCSFSLLEVSQTCSQLIHTRFVVILASGLETRNQLRKRQEKNEFNFRLRQKNLLDWEKKHACRRENRNRVSKNFAETQTATIRNRPGEEISPLIVCASRVDRIGLCTQFSASASGGQTLTKL
jgi:uncharacterized protein involved in type VI secretion and phage assembly